MTTTPITTPPVSLSPARYPVLAELAESQPLADVEVIIKLEKPSFHGQTEFRLRPGVVDADAIELFGFAQCHRLAAAMHERTGWPFALVQQLVDGVWKWAHVGVFTPGGRMLDIHGPREVAEVERQMNDTYGPPARVRSLDTLADLRDAIAPTNGLANWKDDINGAAGVEIVMLLADTLIAKANAESQAESRPVTRSAGHEARALLADAANKDRFYDNSSPYNERRRQALREGDDAATALYAAQAATAHAVLAVAGELAELRGQVHELRAVREDLADIADAVRGLANALTSGAGQSADVADQMAELTGVVDRGLIDVAREVADVAAAVNEHRGRRRSWRNLFRRRPAGPARPGVAADAQETPSPVDLAIPVASVPAISAGQLALERLAHLREVLANWAVTLPDNPNVSGLRQGLAITVYDAWEATRAVIAQVAGNLSISAGPVQDAVLLLEAALHEMGPAGVPSIEAVRAVSDRLTELLKVVAAQAVAARAEVDAR
ncbi:hypothetical protein GCM10022224_080370 [Nonomuraea antimicrobica]|uniref:Uncharacterized protein n=1 Tax=Nonomuraea antimicrobica TaxID=561173 RepID=A0ABP7DCL7_9ACTN